MSTDINYGSKPSAPSVFSIRESSRSIEGYSSLQRYLTEYDRSEEFRNGISRFDNKAASTATAKSRMEALILNYDAEFNGELRSRRGLQNKAEDLFVTVTRANKDEQISEILSAHEQEREINVYPVRVRLPSGENATWDMRGGEERTQPRRGPRRGDSRHRSQMSAPEFSSSADGNRNRIQSQGLIPMIASPPPLQVLQSSEHNSAPEQAGERAESASHPLRLVAPSPESSSGHSPSLNLQSSPLISNIWDNGMHRISNESPSLLQTSAVVSAERSDLSGALLYCELQTQTIQAQQLNAGLPDIVFTQHEEINFDEFLPANNFTPNASNANIFHFNDTSTGSTGPFASLIRISSLPSNAPSHSHGSFVAREAGVSPRLLNPDALAAHADESLPLQKREERADDDTEWFRLCIHEHMLEPTSK